MVPRWRAVSTGHRIPGEKAQGGLSGDDGMYAEAGKWGAFQAREPRIKVQQREHAAYLGSKEWPTVPGAC